MQSKNFAEIDLLALLSKFAWTVRRNLVLICSLTLVGLTIGLGTSFLVKKQYESRLLFSLEVLPYPNIERILVNLNELLREKNYNELSKRLNLETPLLKKLNGIQSSLLIEDPAENSKDIEYVAVKVRTTDTSVLEPFQASLMAYLHNNNYVRARVQQRKEFYTTLIAEIDREIESLTQLKENISSGAFFQAAKGNINFDPTTVNSKILDLARIKIEYKNSLEMAESIHLIEGFTPHTKPITGRTHYSTLLGALMGFLAGFLIMGVKGLNNFFHNHPEGV